MIEPQHPVTDARTAETLATRLAAVCQRMAAAAERVGRPAGAVRTIAVTKTVPPEVIAQACALGLRDFGENRVQEAQRKISELKLSDIRWELIGHLQTNKAARAVELFVRVQSVDSVRLAETLNAKAAALGRMLPVLLEVNVAGEASKSGFAVEDVVDAAGRVTRLEHLRPEGLMTVAPLVEDPEAVRPVFRRLRELRDQLREVTPGGTSGGWDELSMGMSDDFELAIEEGATLVRLGRALFGERPAPV